MSWVSSKKCPRCGGFCMINSGTFGGNPGEKCIGKNNCGYELLYFPDKIKQKQKLSGEK